MVLLVRPPGKMVAVGVGEGSAEVENEGKSASGFGGDAGLMVVRGGRGGGCRVVRGEEDMVSDGPGGEAAVDRVGSEAVKRRVSSRLTLCSSEPKLRLTIGMGAVIFNVDGY